MLTYSDECHHAAAATAVSVLEKVNARYVYGVSATPKRTDELEKIIFMLLGPVRHSFTAKERAIQQGIGHFVYPRYTRVISTEDTTDPETGERIPKIKKWLKNYKISRVIPLTKEALEILDEIDRVKKKLGVETEHLFSEDENPVDYNIANRAMKKLCRQAGLPDHRMYVFRKTWITAMVDHSGLTLAQIANLAGNTSAVIMKSYYGRRDGLPDAATISAALRGGEVAEAS